MTEPGQTTYLYGIVPAEHPTRLGDHSGVGDPPARLRRVDGPGVAAVVSDADAGIRPKRRDLAAHHAVLETLCAQGPTLPIQFGVMAADDDMVAQQLSADGGAYLRMLSDLSGFAEYNVKAAHNEVVALREILEERPDLQARNDSLRLHGGGSHGERVDFGQRVAAALDDLRERRSGKIRARLRAVTERESLAAATEECFLNVSLLLTADDVPRLEATIAELTRTSGDRVELTVTGPLPPYSFVDKTALPGEPARAERAGR